MKSNSLYIITLFATILCLNFVTGATAYWVDDPADCPSLDAGEFPGQDCTPEDICGDSSGTAQCYDTSLLTAPSPTTTYSNNFAGFNQGGFLVNCFVTADAGSPFCDNSGNFWCERNETFYLSYVRLTNCTDFGVSEIGNCNTGAYNCFGDIACEATSTSNCNATTIPNTRYTVATCFTNTTEIPVGTSTCVCDPGHFECDGGIDDADGCEFGAGDNCASNTGDYVQDQCLDVNTANCTNYITGNLDCDDDDSDSNEDTCNGGNGCEVDPGVTNYPTGGNNHYDDCSTCGCDTGYLDCNAEGCDATDGCEVQDGSSCSVGALSGTYDGCTCVVPQSYFETGSFIEYSTNVTQAAMLWFKNHLAGGVLINATNSNDDAFIVDDNTNIITQGNLTITDRIVFGFGEIIDNLVDGWLRLTGNVEVTQNLNVTHNISIANTIKFYYNGSDLIIE